MSDTDIIQLATVQPKPPLDREMGVISDLPFSGAFDAIEVLKTEDITISQLVEMRKIDGQVRSLMRVMTLPIRSTGFSILQGNAGDQEVEFLDQMFRLPPPSGGMTVSYNKFIRQVLLAIVEGFSCFELVFQMPDTGPLKGKITLRKAAHRDAKTVTMVADDRGGFNGFRQKTSFNGKQIDVKIQKEYAWYWAANEEENPLYGVSYFLPAYYHWDKKRKLYYLMHLAAQFHAVPGRVGEYPENAPKGELDAFRKGIRDFGLQTALTHPTGYKVNEFNARGGFDFMPAIDHHNSMMSKSVLAQFIDLGQQEGKGSSYALSEDQSDLFVMAIEAIMQEIEEQITHYLLPKFIDWNFGSDGYPEFKFRPITDSTKDIMKDVFKTLAAASTVQVTPEFIFELELAMAERIGLDMDFDELRKQFDEERELEKKKAIEMLKNPPPPPPPPPGAAQPIPGGQSPPGGAPGGKPPPKPPAAPAAGASKVAASHLLKLDAASAKSQPKSKQGRFEASGSAEYPSKTDYGAGQAAPEELARARQIANETYDKAPVPTEADRIAHAERMAKSSRQGGDDRGNSKDRANRRNFLANKFGDGKTCPCVYCGVNLPVKLIEADRIHPGSAGGRYTQNNIVPACRFDNGSRSDTPFTKFG